MRLLDALFLFTVFSSLLVIYSVLYRDLGFVMSVVLIVPILKKNICVVVGQQ